MQKRRTALTSLAFGALLLVGAAACSSSAGVEITSDSADPAPAAAAPTVAAQTEEAAPTSDVVEDEPEAAAPEAADAPSGSGSIEIAFDDGRNWTLVTTTCRQDPDSAFGIFFMEGVNDTGAELIVVESWPLSGDQSNGTSFIATFIDENDETYVLDAAEVQQVGDSLTFTTGIYEGVFAAETTVNGTFTCTP